MADDKRQMTPPESAIYGAAFAARLATETGGIPNILYRTEHAARLRGARIEATVAAARAGAFAVLTTRSAPAEISEALADAPSALELYRELIGVSTD